MNEAIDTVSVGLTRYSEVDWSKRRQVADDDRTHFVYIEAHANEDST
jgi:hypothetical protein